MHNHKHPYQTQNKTHQIEQQNHQYQHNKSKPKRKEIKLNTTNHIIKTTLLRKLTQINHKATIKYYPITI